MQRRNEIPTDLITPLGAYLQLREGARAAFLLESVERGRLGRHSFVGCGSALCSFVEAERCGEPVVGYLGYDFVAQLEPSVPMPAAGPELPESRFVRPEVLIRFDNLWSIHLNEQNGLKFDQDKPCGSANLRVAFNQVRALERNGYGRNGEYVCFDVHPFRTTRVEHWPAHLDNSRRTFLKLVAKARAFDERKAQQLIAGRNYQALDQMVIEHLLGK